MGPVVINTGMDGRLRPRLYDPKTIHHSFIKHTSSSSSSVWNHIWVWGFEDNMNALDKNSTRKESYNMNVILLAAPHKSQICIYFHLNEVFLWMAHARNIINGLQKDKS